MHQRRSRFVSGIFYTCVLACAWVVAARPAMAGVDVGISVNIAPPALPVYAQPPVPEPGYLWTPGYWAWDGSDYYWVPGTWVEPPESDYLWTPGYWGWNDGLYVWNAGYWGPHVGFYGGIDYGFGYTGHGYEGGYWDHGEFRYNSAYSNVRNNNVHITNVYNKTVVVNNQANRVSFSGGHGGVDARPSPAELDAQHERHLPPVATQQHHAEAARADPALRASANHGHPPVAATAHPGVFSGAGVVGARAAAGSHPASPRPGDANARTQHVVMAPAHAPPQAPARPAEAARPETAARPEERAPSGGMAPHAGPPERANAQREAAPPRPQREAPHEAPREQHEESHSDNERPR
jgi:hypothetical protein